MLSCEIELASIASNIMSASVRLTVVIFVLACDRALPNWSINETGSHHCCKSHACRTKNPISRSSHDLVSPGPAPSNGSAAEREAVASSCRADWISRGSA